MVGGMEQCRRAVAATTAGTAAGATGYEGETVQPVGSQLLWGDPDPLWAVGDWRPDEVRVVTADAQNRIAVLGTCGATDERTARSACSPRAAAHCGI